MNIRNPKLIHLSILTMGMLIGFALGFLAHRVLPNKADTEHDWKVVKDYNSYVRDPSHYKPDAATGLSVTTPPCDPEPGLAALVAAGELRHVDLVFPTVPYDGNAARQWMRFVQNNNKEIIYITGNPSYVEFKTSGKQPLHLNIWFKGSDKAIVQNLIRELEETARSSTQKDDPTKGNH